MGKKGGDRGEQVGERQGTGQWKGRGRDTRERGGEGRKKGEEGGRKVRAPPPSIPAYAPVFACT